MTTKTDRPAITDDADTSAATDAREVPFFARKLGRPALGVRTGVRAGAAEQTRKLD
ncbi:MAG: hypothetical protein H6710_00565 [Myxococcales bacterium]|nr:hypothetical protein [Myxococcales bacterium]MCB9703133.1 hypothetical protein [Myxococcales bacterium]